MIRPLRLLSFLRVNREGGPGGIVPRNQLIFTVRGVLPGTECRRGLSCHPPVNEPRTAPPVYRLPLAFVADSFHMSSEMLARRHLRRSCSRCLSPRISEFTGRNSDFLPKRGLQVCNVWGYMFFGDVGAEYQVLQHVRAATNSVCQQAQSCPSGWGIFMRGASARGVLPGVFEHWHGQRNVSADRRPKLC